MALPRPFPPRVCLLRLFAAFPHARAEALVCAWRLRALGVRVPAASVLQTLTSSCGVNTEKRRRPHSRPGTNGSTCHIRFQP